MKIGIIGSSLSGLVAGEKLAQAGHDVTVIEKARSLGGRLATYDDGEGNIFDYGISHFTSGHADFKSFVNDLMEEEIIREWSSNFKFFDGIRLHDLNPNRSPVTHYASVKGMNVIAEKLSRWVDLKSEEKAGGLTYIGSDRTKKRAWMINLTDISVFECDAVILAAPAVEAYGVLQTAQDETAARRIIRYIDEIKYDASITLMATYDKKQPEWDAIECMGDNLRWIINESSKRNNAETSLVIHSSSSLARKYEEVDPEVISNLMLQKAADISGLEWLKHAKTKQIHLWKYITCINPMEEEFLELELEDAPLALVGDYLGGNSVESAYLSGLRLADYWIDKYEPVNAGV